MHTQLNHTPVDSFTIGRCGDCDALLAPDATVCSSCRGTDIGRVPSAGTGSIVSWSVVEISPSRTFTDFTPYTIAIVALDEGPWTYAWIEGALDENQKHARVRYDRTIAGEPYPMFVRR